MKSWDVVVIGAGVIGLSLGWRLRREGLRVLIIDRSEPGREASYAAGGMIAHCDPHLPAELQPLVRASAAMYRSFVGEIEDESGQSVDLRAHGTLAFYCDDELPGCEGSRSVGANEIGRLEPALSLSPEAAKNAYWLPECSVDPRALCSVLFKAAKVRGVDFVTGSAVTEVAVQKGRAAGIKTDHSNYAAGIVVNCAGAWASQIKPFGVPTRPAKGQMVCVIPGPDRTGEDPVVHHVIRAPEIYVVPRSDRRILLGATLEDAGFNKRTDANTIEKLYRAAAQVVPNIGAMRIHDAWAGLRPASPDNLPIVGETSLPGYFAATGHYRDGIMLAPITAELLSCILLGKPQPFRIEPLSPLRFSTIPNS